MDVIRRRQEIWKYKLDDMNSYRTTKKVYVEVMEGRRPRGRPRMSGFIILNDFVPISDICFSETCRSAVLGMTSSNGDMHP